MCLIFTCGEHTFRKEVEGYEGLVCRCYNCGNYSGSVIKSHPWFTFCFVVRGGVVFLLRRISLLPRAEANVEQQTYSPSFLSRSRGTKTSRAAFATSNNHSNTDRTSKQCAGEQMVHEECHYNRNHPACRLKEYRLKAGDRKLLNRTSQCNIAKVMIWVRGSDEARGRRGQQR